VKSDILKKIKNCTKKPQLTELAEQDKPQSTTMDWEQVGRSKEGREALKTAGVCH